MVNLKVNNPDYLMEMAKHCPYVVNGFRLSGKYNICFLIANTNLEKLYNIVNYHFRTDSAIQKISMELITEFAKDFISPIDFNVETVEPNLEDGCGLSCEFCKKQNLMRYRNCNSS